MNISAELCWPYHCHHHASTQPSGELHFISKENSLDKEMDDT